MKVGRKPIHGEGHGAARTPEYSSWSNMLTRCYSKQNVSYANYGGRGIVVCERWRTSFEAFVADMGRKPSAAHSVDRIDNTGNYTPENCRWATKQEQARNTRSNVLITVDGVTATVAEWAGRIGVSPSTIHQRLYLGWTPGEAVSPGVRVHPSISFFGEDTTVAELSRRFDLPAALLRYRIKTYGMTPEEAVIGRAN